jgi:hypothetical protein
MTMVDVEKLLESLVTAVLQLHTNGPRAVLVSLTTYSE